LLHALAALAAEQSTPPIHAIHVNHHLHPDAGEWSQLCQRHADALGVPLVIADCEVLSSGRGLEADARRARYNAFEQVLEQDEVLFTAHHIDDQVETVLLRLLRGAGPRGLAGIPRQRRCGKGHLFRPFLQVSSTTVRAAVEAAGLEHVRDPSNFEVKQDRNYLRQVVLPAIGERWPAYRETVSRAAELQTLTQRRLSTMPLELTETVTGEPALAVDGALDPPQLAAAIHQWLGDSDIECPDQKRLVELARQALTAKQDRSPELVWGEHTLRVWGGLVIRAGNPAVAESFPEALVVGEVLSGSWGELSWEPAIAGPGLRRGAQLQCVLSGELDRVTPLNRPQKPLKHWCQELRIPPWWRPYLPVLTSQNQPVWLVCAGASGP
jgi:tRNA(Ile)-lysidine synthase